MLVELESKAKVWVEEEEKGKAEEVALSKTRWVWLAVAHCILPVNACQESTFRWWRDYFGRVYFVSLGVLCTLA